MLSPKDKSFIDTMQVKDNDKTIPYEFKKLIDWIADKYGITPINICYEIISNGLPRIEVVFETMVECSMFKTRIILNDKVKQAEVKEAFLDILSNEESKVSYEYKTDRLLVIFSSFAPVARTYANNQITKESIEELKQKYADYGIWEISRFSTSADIFFYTDKQLRENTESKITDEICREYFNLHKAHDKYGYLDWDEYELRFDSKENVDTNYEGNLFYYYR